MRVVLSQDLRTRIVQTYDLGLNSRQEVAERYGVSLGMVKKLLSQRKQTGDIGHRYRYCGTKPYLDHRRQKHLAKAVADQPDITLEELKDALKLDCTIQAIHYVLEKMNLSYKKNAARQRARQRRRQNRP